MLEALIVGQGIAGSNLAFELLSRGKKVAIIDEGWSGAACLVAAGALNPITGKRLVKSWRSDAALPYAKDFYSNLQKKFGAKFYCDRDILQLCKSAEEAELWRSRRADEAYAPFLGGWIKPGSLPNLNDKFGGFLIRQAAWVEAPKVMELYRKHFLGLGILRLEKFDFSRLKICADFIRYGEINAKRLIFCDGWRAVDNPYFSWLPYRPARGEILTLRCGEDFGENIIHREKWLMKCGESLYRCGSTWDRESFRKAGPTDEGKAEIVRALPSIIKDAKFEAVRHESGSRPCTATTRPHLGSHPKFKNVYSFNGFGSKGYSLSPYFARHFADWLFGEAELDKEADLSRHVKKFYKA